jgi:hypothetical protein
VAISWSREDAVDHLLVVLTEFIGPSVANEDAFWIAQRGISEDFPFLPWRESRVAVLLVACEKGRERAALEPIVKGDCLTIVPEDDSGRQPTARSRLLRFSQTIRAAERQASSSRPFLPSTAASYFCSWFCVLVVAFCRRY